jgi:hypothetical protein
MKPNRRRVAAGRYTVEVSRPGNRGTYVFAIEWERWGPAEGVSASSHFPPSRATTSGSRLHGRCSLAPCRQS